MEMDEFVKVASKLEILGLHGADSENVSDVSMTADADTISPDNNGNGLTNTNARQNEQSSSPTEHSMQSTSNSDGQQENGQHLKRTRKDMDDNADSNHSKTSPTKPFNDEKRTRMTVDTEQQDTEMLPFPLLISPISKTNPIDNGNGETTNKTCNEHTNNEHFGASSSQHSPNNNGRQQSPTKRLHTSPGSRLQSSPTKRLQSSPSKRSVKHRLQPSPSNRSDNGNSINNGRYRCETCLRYFETSQHMLRHKRYKCGKVKKFSCHMCPRSFYLRIGIRNHYKFSKCKPNEGCNPDGEIDDSDD